MDLKIIIEASSTDCSIEINGVKREYQKGKYGCKAKQTGDWEDDFEVGKINKAFEDVIDRLSSIPLDAMHACLETEFDN